MAGQLSLLDLLDDGPREVPLAGVGWGTYGTAQGWGPDGRRLTRTGYVITTARRYTGGVGEKREHRGQPLLSFVLLDPPGPDHAPCHIGMYAPMGSMFVRLPSPVDRPLTYPKMLHRRMPAADLVAGDVFYLWEEPGRPRYHVQADPVAVGGGRVEVAVVVDGSSAVRALHCEVYVDVVDPTREPWRAAR